MPFGLFSEWAAFAVLRPFGEAAADYRAACLRESFFALFGSDSPLRFDAFPPYVERVAEIPPEDLIAAVEAENRRTGVYGDDK